MDIVTTVDSIYVEKKSVTDQGSIRLQNEVKALFYLAESPHVPSIVEYDDKGALPTLRIQFVSGHNAKQWLHLDDEWGADRVSWSDARLKLQQYINAESDFLARGVLYRDLNLEHVIFSDNRVIIVDHESDLFPLTSDMFWKLDDIRGTWETMAPEEFSAKSYITPRVATYRAAVFCHLVLTGKLPFLRKPTRQATHRWRSSHPPIVSREFNRATRKIFAAALSRSSSSRHRSPQRFFEELCRAMED